jgi:hypothetical protein
VQAEATTAAFNDRRHMNGDGRPALERRQFGNSYESLSAPARELAEKIDQYKLHHHRRFITYEELYQLIASLGYSQRQL